MSLLVALGVFAVDVGTKIWALRALEAGAVTVGPVMLHVVLNPGGAFGLLPGLTSVFTVVSMVVIGVMLWFGFRWKTMWARVAAGLVAGGAGGNLLDRVARGAVVDFIDIVVWPVFNVADMAIVAGTIVLGYRVLITELRQGGKSQCYL